MEISRAINVCFCICIAAGKKTVIVGRKPYTTTHRGVGAGGRGGILNFEPPTLHGTKMKSFPKKHPPTPTCVLKYMDGTDT